MDGIIGPGSPCFYCDEVYGRHASDCRGEAARVRLQRETDRERGADLLAAIREKNEEAIGRILRAKPASAAGGESCDE